MLNKVLAGVVVVFWVAMMAALVRVEIFPKPTALETFPTDRVLKKIFSNSEPARLNVYFHKVNIGFCAINILPRVNDKPVDQLAPGQHADSYDVTTDLKMKLSIFGTTTRLYLDGRSEFNRNLELTSFDIATAAGDSRVSIAGNDATKKVKVVFIYNDIRDERNFDFDQIKGAGFASAVGMPGLGNLGFLGGGMPASFAATSRSGSPSARPVTIACFDRLDIAGDSQRVYLLDSKFDDQMWTKMWVDDSGQILKVMTSLGLEMISDGLTTGSEYPPSGPCADCTDRNNSMIVTEQLSKQYGGLLAVNDLNLNIPQGQFFAFLGPNGAGKTTTIKLLAGLLRPTTGRALIGGYDIQKDPVEARKILSYVPDMPFLYDKLHPMEFMLFVGQLYGMDRSEAVHDSDELFEVFGLNETRGQIIETLSHGTRQRLVIASALLHRPKVIIIDEPMVGLDPRSARVVKDVLKERSRAGVTVFLSTHILHIAEELADQVGILRHGKLIAVGTIDELREISGQKGELEDAFLALTSGEEAAAPIP